jgi:hypothetical protein
LGGKGFSCHRLADHDNKEGRGERIQNGRYLLDGNNAPFLIIGDAPHSTHLLSGQRNDAADTREDLCDLTLEDLKGITYEINHKGSVHLGFDATRQPH